MLGQRFLALPFKAVHEVTEARHVPARRVARAPASLHQSTQRIGKIAIRHQVVGERVQDLVRLEIGDRLAAVPARISCGPGDRSCGIRVIWWRGPASSGA